MSGETRRSLGFWRCWSLVVGGTIGSAIFMMPAVMAPYGGIGLLSLAVATLGALSIAIMFGNLARRVTVTGGAYAYTRAGLGDFAGFLIAWGGWIGLWVSCTAIAIAFAAYLGAVVPVIGASPVLTAAAGLSLIWVVVGINVAGVRESGIVSLVTTILKLLPLVLIGCMGLLFVEAETLPVMHPGEGNPLIVLA
jgi:APA family basic amino acid/polyamine antiporter